MGITLRGGSVFDPDLGSQVRTDLRWADGLISSPEEHEPNDEVIDVTGLLVTPGLVDLHTHVFDGQDLGLSPDLVAAPSGTTTLIDAGSAGGHLFGAFRFAAVDRSAARIRAFVNIASIGTTSIRLGGELRTSAYIDDGVAVECIERNRDIAIGVKVRASGDVGGENSLEALRRARRAADRVQLPLMVHLGPAPAAIDDIADTLRPGDILTHAFTGWEDNRIVVGGRLRPSVREARQRGVLLDIGHGMSGFSSAVARALIDQGEFPDTISSDLHTYSRSLVVDLPTVLSKLMGLGMSLDEVLMRATLAPARTAAMADGIGTVRPGAPADVAVFRRVHGPVTFTDGFGGTSRGSERLEVVLTIIGGRIAFDARADMIKQTLRPAPPNKETR